MENTGNVSRSNDSLKLFVISFILLFVELTLIRWTPAFIKSISFFTNYILLSVFLGMSVGCLCAEKKIDFIKLFLPVLAFEMILVIYLYYSKVSVGVSVKEAREILFFGAHSGYGQFSIPTFVILCLFFIINIFIFIGPGQIMGRLFNRIKLTIKAYSFNIAGSLAGIIVFTVISYFSLPPIIWFLLSLILVFMFSFIKWRSPVQLISAVIIIIMSFVSGINFFDDTSEIFWSPYYKVRLTNQHIYTNEIGHQSFHSLSTPILNQYKIPYRILEAAGISKPKEIMIIGAGSGNEVSVAIDEGVKKIDAVEIDPVIYEIGRTRNPNKCYSDPRVTIHIQDGRKFSETISGKKKYDMIIFGCVDSLTLLSGYSSARLESFIFTVEHFKKLKECLNDNGILVVYNSMRKDWLIVRVAKMMDAAFGSGSTLVMTMPNMDKIMPGRDEKNNSEYLGMFFNGNINAVRDYFKKNPEGLYFNKTSSSDTFTHVMPITDDMKGLTAENIIRPAEITGDTGSIRVASDNWPFMYLRYPGIPEYLMKGLAGLLAISVSALFIFSKGKLFQGKLYFFLLGLAFMLIETKSIIQISLLFGNTWFVNSITFMFVFVMILIANYFVYKIKSFPFKTFFILLLITVAVNYFFDFEFYSNNPGLLNFFIVLVLNFLPLCFGSFIFSKCFSLSKNPSVDFAVNILGSMLGGLLEYTALIFGYKWFLILIAVIYILTWFSIRRNLKILYS